MRFLNSGVFIFSTEQIPYRKRLNGEFILLVMEVLIARGGAMVKKTLTIVVLLFLFLCAAPAFAASQTVSVKIAEFPVTLNEVRVGNDFLNYISEQHVDFKYYAQYPLLVYKDITYFPMTWNYSNLLNLNTSWTQAGGLIINQGDPTEWKQFSYDTRNSKNAVNQTARIVNFPVTVNGKQIDNSKEEYPLLLFRDVTYFPLTWRFAVDEFGWNYRFGSSGLHIEADNAIHYYVPVPEDLQSIIYHTYISGDLTIWQEFHAPGRVRGYGDMYITQLSLEVYGQQVGENGLDQFGVFDSGTVGYFRVEDGWIYTVYMNHRENNDTNISRPPVPVRVNIQTKQIELL